MLHLHYKVLGERGKRAEFLCALNLIKQLYQWNLMKSNTKGEVAVVEVVLQPQLYKLQLEE